MSYEFSVRLVCNDMILPHSTCIDTPWKTIYFPSWT